MDVPVRILKLLWIIHDVINTSAFTRTVRFEHIASPVPAEVQI